MSGAEVNERDRHGTPKQLGRSVDEVMRAFVREADAWCGIFVVEAVLILTNAGPARKYRVQAPGLSPGRSRIGVSLGGGMLIRDATSAEEDELEEGVGLGFVQIERFRNRGGMRGEVLHQATGRCMPGNAEAVVAGRACLAATD